MKLMLSLPPPFFIRLSSQLKDINLFCAIQLPQMVHSLFLFLLFRRTLHSGALRAGARPPFPAGVSHCLGSAHRSLRRPLPGSPGPSVRQQQQPRRRRQPQRSAARRRVCGRCACCCVLLLLLLVLLLVLLFIFFPA